MAGHGGEAYGSFGGEGFRDGEPWYAREGAREPSWKDLFLGDSAREILWRLCEGDALELGALCGDRLSEAAFLLHPDRLLARVIARVAHGAALGYDGRPPLLEWLLDWVDMSIDELLDEDIEAERMGLPPDGEELDRFVELIPPATGIEPELARRACVFFNELTQDRRIPFYRIVIEGWKVEDYCMEHDRSLDEVVQQIEETTRHLVLLVEDGRSGREEDPR
jgi:hypothetical protein